MIWAMARSVQNIYKTIKSGFTVHSFYKMSNDGGTDPYLHPVPAGWMGSAPEEVLALYRCGRSCLTEVDLGDGDDVPTSYKPSVMPS